MIRCIIVDDEPLAHDLLMSYCERLPHLKVTGRCYDAMEALDRLNSNDTDLIFLDLNMPGLKGFEMLRTLQNPPKVIVTTAYKEYALEGFELAVVDYLLKPFSFERFLKAVNKAVTSASEGSRKESGDKTQEPAENSRFFVKGEKEYHQVSMGDILFVEAKGNYSSIQLTGSELTIHEKISDLEDMLPDAVFMRVHRSFLVSKEKISSIAGNVITIGEHKIPVGQTYKEQVRSKLDL
jgi:DNA-binding LytR/AlgR family response regulator